MMDYYNEVNYIEEEEESYNQDRIEEENHNRKDIQTQDGNQTLITDIDKGKIEEELEPLDALIIGQFQIDIRKIEKELEPLDIDKMKIEKELETALQKQSLEMQQEFDAPSNLKSEEFNNSLTDYGLFGNDESEALFPKFYSKYIDLCQYVLDEQKHQLYLIIFKEIFKNQYLQEKQIQVNLLYLAIVMKLNFEKLPQTTNQNMILDLYNYYIDRINEVLNCNSEEKDLVLDLTEVEKRDYLNTFKGDRPMRNMSFLKFDDAISLIKLFKSLESANNLKQRYYWIFDKCVGVQKRFKQFIQNEKENITTLYKEKLQKFCKRKLFVKFDKFNKGQFETNIYNIVFCNLLERNNQQSIAIDCFIDNNWSWINLLDFKLNKTKQCEKTIVFEKIEKFINSDNVQNLLSEDIKLYFSKSSNKKFNFLELLIKFLTVFKRLSGIPNQQQELYDIIIQICDIRAKRYFQKKQVNFLARNFEVLISSEAKHEAQDVIETILKNPASYFKTQIQMTDNEIQVVENAMKKLKSKILQK